MEAIHHIGQLHDAAGVGDIQVIASLVIKGNDTPITRAQRQVILVGDMAVAKAAVEAPPNPSLCQVVLGAMLDEIL